MRPILAVIIGLLPVCATAAFPAPRISRLIVELRPNTQTPHTPLSATAMQPLQRVRQSGTRQVLALSQPLASAQARMLAARLAARPDVARVSLDVKLRPAAATVADPGFAAQWALQPVLAATATQVGRYGADFQGAWPRTTGSGVVVAVIDTGLRPHPALGGLNPASGNVVSAGYNFLSDCRMERNPARNCAPNTPDHQAVLTPQPDATDWGDWCTAADIEEAVCTTVTPSSWSGTHTAGVIAAQRGTGLTGAAYGARILPVRALGVGGGFSSDIADALLWAIGKHPTLANPHPARVVVLGFANDEDCGDPLQAAIDQARAVGVVVVAAAGDRSTLPAGVTPGGCEGVLTVTATSVAGDVAATANRDAAGSPRLLLAAPGGDPAGALPAGISEGGIVGLSDLGATTPSGPAYATRSGSGAAAAHVAAASALLLALNPKLDSDAVATLLQQSATPFPTAHLAGIRPGLACSTAICGAGILNAGEAVSVLLDPALVAAPSTIDFGTVRRGGTLTRTLTLTNQRFVPVSINRLALTGSTPSPFDLVTDGCSGQTLAPAARCSLSLRFDPADRSGLQSATLQVEASLGPALSLPVQGTLESVLTVSPATLTLPAVTVGQSREGVLTYSNASATSITLGSAQFDTSAGFALIHDSCSGRTLAAGARCTLTVRATPSTAGSTSARVLLNSVPAGYAPAVSVSITAEAAPPASANAPKQAGCSAARGGPADPLLPGLVTLALLGLLRGRWSRRGG